MRRYTRCVAVVLVILLGLSFSGCASIQNDGTRTRTEGTLLGTGVGAGIGAGIGALLGDGTGALIGAGIGALVGGVSGYFVGDHIAKKKESYASEEEWLDGCIAQARQVNTEAAKYNATLKKDLLDLDKKSARMQADYKQKKVDREVMVAESKSVKKRQEEVAANMKILENEIANQKTVLADAKTNQKIQEAKELDKEIAALQKKLDEMKAYNSKLASISVRVAV